MRTGTSIKQYRIGDLLGQGGMGDVYRALDTRLDRPVALKFLAHRYISDPEAKERFIREAKSVSALDHPNICTVHDIGETDDGELYIVMALYEGATLKELLARERFSAERTVYIVRQLAEALKRAHAGGIIHRDVKPANTMVTEGDAVRLLDFGVAKLQSAESLTQTGATVGTAAYMSTEQAAGDPITPASDVWSLGVMAYEMLTGDAPFKGEHPMAMINAILSKEPPELTSLRPDVPGPVAAVFRRALAKKPEDRFADAADFLNALDEATGGRRSTASSPAVPLAFGGGRRRIWPGIVAAVAVVAALSAVALGDWGSDAPAGGEETRDVIAVLPFTVNGGPELAYLGEGLMDLVSGRLDGAGTLRVVDPR
ncbi:MAG TPA: serine/threonine-protein kinase, partial [Longimicrobiales bacterium]|nr:serine/threonine-protein kinase [Longimicrobiales bacterium]